MMRAIIDSSIRFRLLVVALAAGAIAVGVTQLPKTSVEVLPDFTPPTVEVQTEALGLSAEEVEELITVPLEQDLLNGVAFLDDIRSESVPGLSRILMVFEEDTDLYTARQVVAERLTQAHALPNVSKPPQMLQPLSSTNRAMMVSVSSKQPHAAGAGRARAVDDRATPRRSTGRRQRRDLGPAGPSASGPGRSGETPPERRDPASGRRVGRQLALGLAADVHRGLDTRVPAGSSIRPTSALASCIDRR